MRSVLSELLSIVFMVIITIIICSIYFNIQIDNLKNTLDVSEFLKTQEKIIVKMDSVQSYRNLQIEKILNNQKKGLQLLDSISNNKKK